MIPRWWRRKTATDPQGEAERRQLHEGGQADDDLLPHGSRFAADGAWSPPLMPERGIPPAYPVDPCSVQTREGGPPHEVRWDIQDAVDGLEYVREMGLHHVLKCQVCNPIADEPWWQGPKATGLPGSLRLDGGMRIGSEWVDRPLLCGIHWTEQRMLAAERDQRLTGMEIKIVEAERPE